MIRVESESRVIDLQFVRGIQTELCQTNVTDNK